MSGFEKPEEQVDWGEVNVWLLQEENRVLREQRDAAREIACRFEQELARYEQ